MFFVFILLCITNADTISITVNLQAEQESCYNRAEANNSVICKDLDSAVKYATSLHGEDIIDSSTSSVTIFLPKGLHYVTTQTYFGNTNVNFVGLSHSVTVLCDYYADNETLDATLMHTWYFNKSRSIEMENINFRDCGFPFRFLFVQRINITNCTYM